jgi:hypothetical protein
MTPEAWATAAIELAVDTGASEIYVESFMAREGYLSVVKTALRRTELPHPIRVTSWPPRGDTTGRGRGDAMARSAKLIQALETGAVRLVGELPSLQRQAVQWQHGTHQPDCLATLIVAFDVLSHVGGIQFADPVGTNRIGPPPAWMRQRIVPSRGQMF